MNNGETSILIIDDHPAIAQGTKSLLEQSSTMNVKVIEVANSGTKGLELVEKHNPHIVLLDLNIPDIKGAEIARIVKRSSPKIHIIIFTGYDYVPYLNSLIEIGVSAIISKSATPQQMRRIIEAVMDGETILPLSIYHQMRFKGSNDPVIRNLDTITQKEKHILLLVANGSTNEAIASELNVTRRTVENYLRIIYDKLGVNSRAEAVSKSNIDKMADWEN